MCKWEKLGVSKEIFEACEELAKAGLFDEVKEKVEKCTVEKAYTSELKCDSISKGDIESFVTIVGDDNSNSISTINKDSINLKVNNINVDTSKVEDEILWLGSNMRLTSGTIDTSKIHINEEMLANPDEICLECDCCGCLNNEETIYEQVMTEVVDELEEELREIIEETSGEEELCLSCLIRFFLEKSYSEGYKEGIRYYKDLLDEANQSIKDELLTEVVESGYED